MGTTALPAFLPAASPCADKVRTGTWGPGLVFTRPGTMTGTVGQSLPFPGTRLLQLSCERQPPEKLF